MIKHTLIFATVLFSFAACNTPDHQQEQRKRTVSDTANGPFSRFIPMDSANKMIGSYLNSIDTAITDSNLKALVIDMDQLRKYTDTLNTGHRITHLKLFFAHTLEYINASHASQNVGYKSGALTLVVAGYDSSGNYVFFNGSNVLEYLAPCPYNCPPGNAGNSFLTN